MKIQIEEADLRSVLDALEGYATAYSDGDEAITICKQALAEQPEYRAVKTWHDGKPVYVTEQPAQQQEPVPCKSLCELCVKRGYSFCANAAQTTPIPAPQPAQQQEPVAWHHPECEGECLACLIEGVVQASYGSQGLAYLQRHLAAPPASKPWVGLTEEDRLEIWKKSSTIDGAINATATKLKEKNT